MARMREPRFKKCRRLGLNVCGHPKAMNRVGNGQERKSRRPISAYGEQLLEKQRLRGYYEVMEKQFRRYVKKAFKSKENTGDALIIGLECRLDNIAYRMNFANSIRQARQMVVHGHVEVNGKKVDRPSFEVKVGDVLSIREKSRNNEVFRSNYLDNICFSFPYLSKDESTFSGKLIRKPERDQIPVEINDHLVVEFYSKII